VGHYGIQCRVHPSDGLNLTVVIPQLAEYDIPKGTVERIIATHIAGECLYSPPGRSGVPINADFTGVFSTDIVANSAFYSGNFFVPEIDDSLALFAPTLTYAVDDQDASSYINDVEIRAGGRTGTGAKPFNITITLVGQYWAADIVTNTDKRDRIVDSILSPLNNASNISAFPKGMQYQVSTKFITNLVRVSDAKLVLFLVPLPSYTLPRMARDQIHTQPLPEDALAVHGKVERTGQMQVEVRSRTAMYSAEPGKEFYMNSTAGHYLTDYQIRSGTWITYVTLFGDIWIAKGLNDQGDGLGTVDNYDCGVRAAVFMSNKTAEEFPHGMSQNTQHVQMQLLAPNLLQLTTHKISSYQGIASVPELLSPSAIPARCTYGGIDVTWIKDIQTMHINSRTAVYSGSFYTDVVSDAHVRDSFVYKVIVDITWESWATDLESNSQARLDLTRSIFASSRKAGYPDYYSLGFEASMFLGLLSTQGESIKRVNDSRVEVLFGSIPTYIMPPTGYETLVSLPIPAECLLNPESIKLWDGLFTTTIYQRTAMISGDFYDRPLVTAGYLQQSNRTLRVDVTHDTWADGMRTNTSLQKLFLHGIMHSDGGDNSSTATMPHGLSGLIDAGQIFISPSSFIGPDNTSILITIPKLLNYTSLPSTQEAVSFKSIPGECLASSLDVRVAAIGPYPGKRQSQQETFSTVFFANATAIYTGNFYGPMARHPSHLSGPSHLTFESGEAPFDLQIFLLDAKWAEDIATNPEQTQLLLATVLRSDKRRGAPDYLTTGWEALTWPGAGLILGGIYPLVKRVDAHTVTIEIQRILKYELPYGMQEVIEAQNIPKKLLLWPVAGASSYVEAFDVWCKWGYHKLTLQHQWGAFENLGQGRGQWAVQSSVTSDLPIGYAYKALDDGFDLVYMSGDCIKTSLEMEPWWRCDLGWSRWIRSVSLVTPDRVSVLDPLTQTIAVAVGNDLGYEGLRNPLCAQKTVGVGSQADYDCLGKVGQYVMVFMPPGDRITPVLLTLCEVQIFSAGALISRDRPTHQSSQHFRYGPQRAVDGNRGPGLALGSCTHTLEQESPWWRVALDSTMRVQAVVVYNRDMLGSRLSGAQVRVGDAGSPIQQGQAWNSQCGEDFSFAEGAMPAEIDYCTTKYGKETAPWNEHCLPMLQRRKEIVCDNGPIPGRYVYIIMPGKAKILTLCEVEVYGVDCDQNCYASYESTAGGPGSMTPGILGPEATQCREVSPTGECAELDPIASTRLTVSTWGVDH